MENMNDNNPAKTTTTATSKQNALHSQLKKRRRIHNVQQYIEQVVPFGSQKSILAVDAAATAASATVVAVVVYLSVCICLFICYIVAVVVVVPLCHCFSCFFFIN